MCIGKVADRIAVMWMSKPKQARDHAMVTRILLPSVVIFVFFVLTIFLVILPFIESRLMDQKRLQIKGLVDTVHATLAHHEAQEALGLLSREEAQQHASEQIRTLRYGPEDKDYFWLNSMDLRMVVHPYRLDLEGQDISGFTDPNGKHLFVECVEVVSAAGAGYVEYMWQWKDDPNRIVPKVSYVRGFEPWDWVVGTGIYVEDVREELAGTRRILAGLCGAILLVSAALCAFLAWEAYGIDTHRKRAQQETRDSEEKYRYLVQKANSIILRMSTEGTVTFFNEFAQHFFGFSEEAILGKSVIGTIVPETDSAGRDLEEMIQEIGHHPERYAANENENMRRNGDRVWIAWTNKTIFDEEGNPAEILCVGNDITARKQLENQLRHSQKMEAIGTLAGGIAHDFNNILWAVTGNLEVALMDELPDGHPAAYSLNQALGAAGQAKDLVAQILAFSRQQEEALRPLRFTILLKETVKLLEAALPATVRICTDLRAQSDVVLLEPSQLQQVVMNLCTNAAHAMRERGGELRVGTENMSLGPHDPESEQGAKLGPFFKLTISDTGEGIPEAISERIYEPYFTTKTVGEGTGLGLAVVHGIVKKLGGTLSFETEKGKGTTFSVLLPLVDEEVRESEEETAPPRHGTEHILLVDDQESVLAMLTRLLERLGYAVTAQTSAADAIRAFDDDPEGFDLVITDLTMPDMTGDALAAEVHKRMPETPVILCTGHTDTMGEEACERIGVQGLVRKPIAVQHLSETVRNVLDNKEDAGEAS